MKLWFRTSFMIILIVFLSEKSLTSLQVRSQCQAVISSCKSKNKATSIFLASKIFSIIKINLSSVDYLRILIKKRIDLRFSRRNPACPQQAKLAWLTAGPGKFLEDRVEDEEQRYRVIALCVLHRLYRF